MCHLGINQSGSAFSIHRNVVIQFAYAQLYASSTSGSIYVSSYSDQSYSSGVFSSVCIFSSTPCCTQSVSEFSQLISFSVLDHSCISRLPFNNKSVLLNIIRAHFLSSCTNSGSSIILIIHNSLKASKCSV